MNDLDGYSNTPLHLACQKGNIDAAEILIAKGSISGRDQEKNTPLHKACLHGHSKIVAKILEKLGTDCNI